MIGTFVATYLIVGTILALVVWWASFSDGFDDYVRNIEQEEPPTTTDKWIMVIATIFVWPYSLWAALK